MKWSEMNKFRKILFACIVLIACGLGVALYLYNMPARDVVGSRADLSIHSDSLVNEFLKDEKAANAKYLAEDGDSKIVQITGSVFEISEDMESLKVILLKGKNDKAGVSCTFTKNTNIQVAKIKMGQIVTIKGVIRSGANYDADLEMFENVILEKCNIIN